MGDEWDGLRAVFGELGSVEAALPATADAVAARALELAANATRELVALSGKDSQLLSDALAVLGPDEPAAWMLVSQARKSC